MTFRDEYKKCNDSIHAPVSILEAIKEKAANETAEETSPLFESKPRRRWISIATYSGVAVAAAALVLLVFNPFRTSKAAAPVAADAASAEYRSETLALGSSVASDSAIESESAVKSEQFVTSFSAPSSDSTIANGLEDSEPEEMFPVTIDELTYSDIFDQFTPSEQKSSVSHIQAPVLLTKESGARFSGNTVTIGNDSVDLPPERSLIALADLSGKVLAVSEYENRVYVTSIEMIEGKLSVTEEAWQSGVFQSCYLHDSSVFEDDALVTYPVFEVISSYIVDSSSASNSDPSTYCPVISDVTGTRALEPSEITLYNPSDIYTVYAGYECTGDVRILYTFAEMGLE